MKKILLVFALLFITPFSFKTTPHSSLIPSEKYLKVTTVPDKKTSAY